MKAGLLDALQQWEADLRALKRDVTALESDRVSRKALRERADDLATRWVEDLRSPLEHKFHLPEGLIRETSGQMKRLHTLARPNNLKSSYLAVIGAVLKRFKDKFILPIKQTATNVESVFDLHKVVAALDDAEESDYLREAIDCANAGYHRAAIVLGWCAAVDRAQRKLISIGLAKFNAASETIKRQTSGKRKNWNKSFSVTTLAELQAVFDTDLIVVMEGMGLIDGNQSERLMTCFQYRNHSAHPGQAPIGDAHLVTFFTDIAEIVLVNSAFALPASAPSP